MDGLMPRDVFNVARFIFVILRRLEVGLQSVQIDQGSMIGANAWIFLVYYSLDISLLSTFTFGRVIFREREEEA